MKPKPTEFAEQHRVTDGYYASSPAYGNNGSFRFPFVSNVLYVIVSDGGDWDHVSVSCRNRCPNWKEMCYVKAIFFEPHELVMQIHPPESEYINNHAYCLHMWRPQKISVPVPPSWMVGYKMYNLESP
jgi:hypothetical protein